MKQNEILKKDLKDVTIGDVKILSKMQLSNLFCLLDAPRFGELKGEYEVRMIKTGLLSGWFSDFYVHVLMGPGRWVGDAFYPFEESQGWGYNKFRKKIKGETKIFRTLKMDTYIGKSVYDDKNSIHVVYSSYHRGHKHSMRDEIRKINDKLYLGIAYFSWSGGKNNPGFFLIIGEATEWIGLDDI